MITNADGTTSFIPNENIFLGALVAEVVAIVIILACKKPLNKKAENV
jgi:hypothetical protein